MKTEVNPQGTLFDYLQGCALVACTAASAIRTYRHPETRYLFWVTAGFFFSTLVFYFRTRRTRSPRIFAAAALATLSFGLAFRGTGEWPYGVLAALYGLYGLATYLALRDDEK